MHTLAFARTDSCAVSRLAFRACSCTVVGDIDSQEHVTIGKLHRKSVSGTQKTASRCCILFPQRGHNCVSRTRAARSSKKSLTSCGSFCFDSSGKCFIGRHQFSSEALVRQESGRWVSERQQESEIYPFLSDDLTTERDCWSARRNTDICSAAHKGNGRSEAKRRWWRTLETKPGASLSF